MSKVPDVSVILPFADHEDVIGTAVRRLSAHLRELGFGFELIAVDEDSGDNSHAVLALLRPDFPELHISNAPGRGRGIACGARRARGKALWVIEPTVAAASPLAPFGRAHRRVVRGERELVAVGARFIIGNRTRCLPVIDGMRGTGWSFQRKLARRAQARGLAVEHQVVGGAHRARAPGERRLSRLLGALAPARFSPLRAERNLW